jgi:thioredoxin 1
MAEVTLNDGNFEEEVVKAEGVVFVDFWASWCMPCKMMAPIVENLARQYEGKAKICKLNVDEGQKTAATYGIRSIPTVIIFKDGKQVEQSVGVLPEEEFGKKLDALL